MAGGLRRPGAPVPRCSMGSSRWRVWSWPLELTHQQGDPGRGPAAPRRPGARWAAADGGAPGARPPAGGSRPGACGTPLPWAVAGGRAPELARQVGDHGWGPAAAPLPWAAAGGQGPGARPQAGGAWPEARGALVLDGQQPMAGPLELTHQRHPGTPVLDGQQPMAGPLELVHQLGDPGRGPAAPRPRCSMGSSRWRCPRSSSTSRGIPAGGLRRPGALVPERGRDLISLNLMA